MPNSNEKGADYERSVCQRLSLWVSNMTRTDCFWRAAMSGGRATLKAQRKGGAKFDAHAGDISATHELGHCLTNLFDIECKFYKWFNLEALFFGHRGEILPIWEKLVEEARGFNKAPLLIAKQNRSGEIVCTDDAGLDILKRGKEDLTPIATFHHLGMHVLPLRDVLTQVRFDKIRSTYESTRNRRSSSDRPSTR